MKTQMIQMIHTHGRSTNNRISTAGVTPPRCTLKILDASQHSVTAVDRQLEIYQIVTTIDQIAFSFDASGEQLCIKRSDVERILRCYDDHGKTLHNRPILQLHTVDNEMMSFEVKWSRGILCIELSYELWSNETRSIRTEFYPFLSALKAIL